MPLPNTRSLCDQRSLTRLKSSSRIRIGTRGSPLALAQTQIVVDLLRKTIGDDLEYDIDKILTDGDKASRGDSSVQTGKDSFTKAIDKALVAGEPLRNIAERVPISPPSLLRHKNQIEAKVGQTVPNGQGPLLSPCRIKHKIPCTEG